MRTSLLTLVCCPACGGILDIVGVTSTSIEIWEGDLRCSGCGAVYGVRRGIPHLYVNDARWAPKAREAQGWVDFHKERGIYIQPEDAVDLKIPYYPEEPWITVANSFDIALQELAPFLKSGLAVLDLGAGRGWAAKQFALRGCKAVALDITADENIGLGRAWALMKHAGVYFDLIIADGEQLPLLPESFDLVFCAATLHHTSDLPLFMKNIHRVLKPDGMLCAIGEPCIAIDQSAQRVLARDAGSELKHGINEQRPNLLEYWNALNDAGFREISFIWPPGYRLSMPELINCAKDIGAIHPAWSEYGWRINLRRWTFYLYHRVASLSRRRAVNSLPIIQDERQSLMRSILLWVSGEVQIFARKKASFVNGC